jgi:DNA-binding NtrC family response regulator
LSAKVGRGLTGVSSAFERRLMAHPWPGNVRELEHVIGRAAILEDGAELEGRAVRLEPLSAGLLADAGPAEGFRPGPKNLRDLAEDAVRRAGGNKSRAAALLGVSRKTLYAWLADS